MQSTISTPNRMVPNYGTKGLAILGPANFHLLQQIQLIATKTLIKIHLMHSCEVFLWCQLPAISYRCNIH